MQSLFDGFDLSELDWEEKIHWDARFPQAAESRMNM
jgi:hypothetical protein